MQPLAAAQQPPETFEERYLDTKIATLYVTATANH